MSKILKTHWDKSVKGLHIRERESGVRTYFFFYRTKSGQQRRPKIGDANEIGVQEARKRALALSAQVAQGLDPKGEWDASKAEPTFDEAFNKTYQGHWLKARFVESKHSDEVYKMYFRHVEKTFGGMKLSAITPAILKQWLTHFENNKTPTTGNRALAVISKVFSYYEELDILPLGSNPCLGIKRFKERKRSRFATLDEIKGILKILEREREAHPREVAFIYLLMLTGARPSAIERATWRQLKIVQHDQQRYGVLDLKGKTSDETGELDRIILSPAALNVIDALPRTGETITGVKMPRGLWERVREEVGADDLWARDWRRTFATLGMSNGIGAGVIGELLNHRSVQTTKIYAKLMDEDKMSAAGAIADRIAGLVH